MRKQEKFIVWPAYFDVNRTRKNGRRVPKAIALQSPRLTEISEAAAKLGLKPELFADKAYPKTPWQKNGLLLVSKKWSKQHLLKNVAKQLLKMRGTPQKAQP
jgi:signal recognition particle subunit SRP19